MWRLWLEGWFFNFQEDLYDAAVGPYEAEVQYEASYGHMFHGILFFGETLYF